MKGDADFEGDEYTRDDKGAESIGDDEQDEISGMDVIVTIELVSFSCCCCC